MKRVNELIKTKGIEVTWCNSADFGKTVLHKAAEEVMVLSPFNLLSGLCRDRLLPVGIASSDQRLPFESM